MRPPPAPVIPPAIAQRMQLELPIVCKPKWWLTGYIWGVALCCEIFGAEPDWARVRYWAVRGYKVYFDLGHGRLRRIL